MLIFTRNYCPTFVAVAIEAALTVSFVLSNKDLNVPCDMHSMHARLHLWECNAVVYELNCWLESEKQYRKALLEGDFGV